MNEELKQLIRDMLEAARKGMETYAHEACVEKMIDDLTQPASQPVAWYRPAGFDPNEPWEAIHAASLQERHPTNIEGWLPLYTHSRACPVGIDWCPNGAPQPVGPGHQ